MRARLPLTVISGYLGAGKTTLINRLLSEDHGLRLMVMVNDFGAINIDAALLAQSSDDTLTLTNGCVCCTMGADLYMAIGDVLDRAERPDHLVIEASGIADPARIAQVAQAEPELVYGGIATVVDGLGYESLATDAQIGPQVSAQVRVADLVLISKLSAPDPALALRLGIQSRAAVLDLATQTALAPMLFGINAPRLPASVVRPHDGYTSWSHEGGLRYEYDALHAKLTRRPTGLFRVKGFVGHTDTTSWEIHCVGPSINIKPLKTAHSTQLVGIGLPYKVTWQQIEDWWLG